jgi:hypothetical protein
LVETIEANLAFSELQEMRAASPTGGALGQVSERELTFLKSAVKNLDQGQSPDQMRRNLQELQRYLLTSKQQRQANYQADFFDIVPAQPAPGQPAAQPQQPSAAQPPAMDMDAEADRLIREALGG